MINITSAMTELIKSAVLGEPLATGFNEPTEQMVAELYRLSKFHDIANIIGSSLIDNGLVKSADMREKFQKEIMLSIYRERQMSAELKSISEAFGQAKIEFIPLKGSVIRPLYAKPWLRTSCDIDILVRESDLDMAVGALTEKLGYTTDGKKKFHDVSLYSRSGVHLELHYNIDEGNDKMDTVLDRVWQHSESLREGDFEFRQSPEFLLFYVIAHTANHFQIGGCGIRSFVDIFLLLRNGNYDESALALLCEEAGVEQFRHGANELICAWFDGGEYTERALMMQNYIFSGGLYGTFEQNILARHSESGNRVKYILKRIFIPYNQLKERYPIVERYPLLVPFCQVRRWIEFPFRKRRIGRAVKEYKHLKSISDEESKKTIELFDSLGLR